MEWRNTLVAVGLLAWVLGHASAIHAADSFKVAVIDVKMIMEKTKAGKRALDEMKQFQVSRQRILAADEEEFKNLEKELRGQESGLSEAARRGKQEQLGTKYESYQRRIQEFNREIQAKSKALGEEYQKKIGEIAMEVAEKEGYVAVLDKGNDSTIKIVLYNQNAIDLTDRVVKEFDRKYQ